MKKLGLVYRTLCVYFAVSLILPSQVSAQLPISFTYNSTGTRHTMTDASGTTTYTYDAHDRVLSKATPFSTLYYTYDAGGLVTNVWSSTPNGISLQYQYDALGRLTNVVDLRLTALTRSNTSYKYSPNNKLIGCVYPNGVSNTYSYNVRDVLTNETVFLASIQLASFNYNPDAADFYTNLTETVLGTNRTYSWRYDSLHRLTNETLTASSGPSGQLAYGYDLVGNRTNRTGSLGPLGSISYSYNTNDQLTTDSYDTNGNTTISGGNTYSYDPGNHLTGVNNGAVTIVYNGDGLRVTKTVGGATTLYLIDENNPTGYPQVVEEFTASGGVTNLSRVYAYGLDLISQRQAGVSTNYFIHDGHDSTRLLTDTAGNVVNAFAYDAYGTLIASNAAPQTAYLYSGEQWDSDLGLYYLLARYYSPVTGRFWTPDTSTGKNEDPLSLHKYLYCADDPVNRVDRDGKDWLGIAVIAVFAVAVILGGVYAYEHLGKPVYQQTTAVNMRQQDLDTAIAELRKYGSVNQKFDLLIDAIGDGRIYVKVTTGGGAAGQHLELNTSTLYISDQTVAQGPLATALVMFAEFQHDPQSGEIMDEQRAQAEFAQVRDAIRKMNPSAITPFIDGLHHGNGGF